MTPTTGIEAGTELSIELGFVAALLGIVLIGTSTSNVELGTELGFVAALLGIGLGDTPTSNLELGTEGGVSPTGG